MEGSEWERSFKIVGRSPEHKEIRETEVAGHLPGLGLCLWDQRRVPLILRRGSHERPSHAAVSEAVPSWTAGEGSRNKKPWWMRASPDHPLILVWWHPQNLTPKFINVFIKYKHGIIKKPKLSGVHCAVNTLSLRWFRTAFNPSPRVDLQDKTENYWFVSLFLMHYV